MAVTRLDGLGQALTALGCGACAATPERVIHGGSISECYAWRCGTGVLFVKVAPRGCASGFEAEAAGLEELGRARALRVPRVLGRGGTQQLAFLALEWLDCAAADERCERRLGEGLARLHATTAPHFGFHTDNLIGSTPQLNGWHGNWAEFFRERRLRPQLELAARRGLDGRLTGSGEALLESVPKLLAGHRPVPSLLHGDLWGGNWLATADGNPVIFDPAVYYGDREAELAMTRLFGGFTAAFYQAYGALAPLPAGHESRSRLYNLYHVLNHANIFGGGYVVQATRMMERLLGEVAR